MGPRHLLRDRRGAATIEFALLTCFLFAIMLAALDFGMFFIQRGNLGSGVATTAVHSFSNRAAVPFTNIPTMVAAIAGAPGASNLVVTVECNGGDTPCVNESRVCACLTADNGYRATATCGAPCGAASGSAAARSGYYLRVKASYRYVPAVVPASLFGDTTLEQAAVVRLQ
ncbi:TadE/TadG family type IV pilus assembly protein [Sphingomonas sp. 2R-10]|uniref:TadE/TadG family type IV pilus assembly protein n=1 Tax=Sphingomonas sp. 2R-10 TaxID=3045148 RepID=UPI0024B8835E|nr:TadE/TadG family type IV pilus assembly protein [Sphingomonas sp. 2R-10]MDJ0277987.1 TadE/TadG family type IV pilus assembly protein [Sphingomonas sp. 2R-10]